MNRWMMASLMGLLLANSPAHADRTQIYSITGVDCVECATPIKSRVRKLRGVRKVEFDKHKVELTVSMDDHLSDAAVQAAVASAGPGFRALVGAGAGAYIPFGAYPKGADVAVLTDRGAAVGSLERLRVRGKYTVFDFYADWCGPCRAADAELRRIVAARSDVAVRKLNVMDFSSPLAREQGAKLQALPYLVVFSPGGKRTDLVGAEPRRIAASLVE